MKIVIIGGDAAGMSAAMEIIRSGIEATITVLEKGDIYSYGQCGLPYIIDGTIPETDDLIARSVEGFRAKGIDARVHCEVTAVNVKERIVSGIHTQTQEAFAVPYDKLLIATGASPTIPKWEHKDLDGIHTIKTIPQMQALMDNLRGKKHATVIGGGYIALEVAETLKESGLNVRIIQRSKQLMSTVDAELAEHILAAAQRNGVEVVLDTNTLGFVGDTHVTAVNTSAGELATDVVIIATGVKPNTGFMANTGLYTLPNGAAIVDGQMMTNIADVYAAGDCAAHYLRHANRYGYIPLGTTANKQGRIAGRVMAGKQAQFKGILGTSILKFFDIAIGQTGMNHQAVANMCADVEVYRLSAKDHAGYYPNAEVMHMCMWVNKHTQKLLGLQIVGGDGVDKRIDVFATALAANMHVEDLVDLDLAYAPPYNGVWDPLQQVARRHIK